LALSAIIALTILALVLPIAGLHRVLGMVGLPVSALLFFLFANPASGNASAPELLPNPWRWLGQLLPPGAGGSTVRNTGYFGGAALVQPLIVLIAFCVGGGLLVLGAERLRGLKGDGHRDVVVALRPRLGNGTAISTLSRRPAK